MSYELADLKNPVRISVSFWPFTQKVVFAECSHASAPACRLSLMLTVFIHVFTHSAAGHHHAFLCSHQMEMSVDIPIWMTLKKFTSVTWPRQRRRTESSGTFFLTVVITSSYFQRSCLFRSRVSDPGCSDNWQIKWFLLYKSVNPSCSPLSKPILTGMYLITIISNTPSPPRLWHEFICTQKGLLCKDLCPS